MARSLTGEARRVNINLLWCDALLLAAGSALAAFPSFFEIKFPDGAYWFWIVAAPFVVLALWNLEKGLRRGRNLELNPLLENLRAQGAGVIEAIDRDLEWGQDFLSFTLSPSWLLKRGFFKLELAALSDAVWAYNRESYGQHIMYFQTVVALRNGKSLSTQLTSSTKKLDAFLEQISKNAPWVILGENDDLTKLWKKDRQNFVAQVDQRRKVLGGNRRSEPFIS